MPKNAVTWAFICEIARELDERHPRVWKQRGRIPDAARWRLYKAARKRRIILTDADFDAVIQPKDIAA